MPTLEMAEPVHEHKEPEPGVAQTSLHLTKALREGPLFTGDAADRPGKTYVHTENLNSDGLVRYTDRYLRKRRIGNTLEEYDFDPEFFPPELQRAMGASTEAKERPAKSTRGTRLEQIAPIERVVTVEATTTAETEEPKEPAESESDEAQEDEFEEFEDDDYNAEKYFDDGDEYGDLDGEDEAAY